MGGAGTGAEAALVESLLAWLTALAVAAARVQGFVRFFPLFVRLGLQGPVSGGVALALAVPGAVVLQPLMPAVMEAGPLALLGLVAKELLVGAGLGLLLGVPFWAVQAAGDVVDLYRGASAANLFDPLNVAEASTLGTVLLLLSLALFVVADGLPAALGVLYDSYAVWPPQQPLPRLDVEAARLFGRALSTIVNFAFILSAPLLIIMVASDIAYAFLGRSAQKLQIFDLSTGTKNMLVILLAPVYAAFLSRYLEGAWARGTGVVRALFVP